ncbi:MAG: hypothetical protein ACREP7_04070 [Lysobacter sp.]
MPMQFHFQDHGPYAEDEHFGHRFSLRIVLAQRRGARLVWFERCDRPYDPDMPQDTWVDMHALAGARLPVFAQWLETTLDGGRVEIDFDHRAAMHQAPYAQRTLEWCVVMVDGEDDDADEDGQREWSMWRGVQQLSCDGEGHVLAASLRSLGLLHGRSDQPPRPDELPHY